MTEESSEVYRPPVPPTLWQENHGSLLVGLMLGIFLIGAGVLSYQQSRFVPAPFPEGRHIETEGIALSGFPADSEGPFLTISVVGAANNRGMIVIAIYDTAVDFIDASQASLQSLRPIEAGVGNWVVPISYLPDKFAIAAYHDENGDAVLNRKEVDGQGEVVMERFGFSNRAGVADDPPSFGQAVINRPEQDTTIEILIR